MSNFYLYLEAAKKKPAPKKAAPKKQEKVSLDTQSGRSPFPCTNCKGYGKLENEDNAVCPICKGRGEFNSDEDRKMAMESYKLQPKVKAIPNPTERKTNKKKS